MDWYMNFDSAAHYLASTAIYPFFTEFQLSSVGVHLKIINREELVTTWVIMERHISSFSAILGGKARDVKW